MTPKNGFEHLTTPSNLLVPDCNILGRRFSPGCVLLLACTAVFADQVGAEQPASLPTLVTIGQDGVSLDKALPFDTLFSLRGKIESDSKHLYGVMGKQTDKFFAECDLESTQNLKDCDITFDSGSGSRCLLNPVLGSSVGAGQDKLNWFSTAVPPLGSNGHYAFCFYGAKDLQTDDQGIKDAAFTAVQLSLGAAAEAIKSRDDTKLRLERIKREFCSRVNAAAMERLADPLLAPDAPLRYCLNGDPQATQRMSALHAVMLENFMGANDARVRFNGAVDDESLTQIRRGLENLGFNRSTEMHRNMLDRLKRKIAIGGSPSDSLEQWKS